MFLTTSREWHYDPMIKVIPHYARNGSDTFPCRTEYNTDYVGQQLARMRQDNVTVIILTICTILIICTSVPSSS